MKWYDQKTPRRRQKKFIIPLVLIAFLVALRLVLPPVILSIANSKLKDISPTIEGHIGKLKLGVIKGSIVLEEVTARIKKTDEQFLVIDSVKTGISWEGLIKGDVVADVVVNKADMTYSDELKHALKVHMAEMKEEEKEEAPIRIGRVDIKDSTMRMEPGDDLTRKDDILIDHIEGRITNVTPTRKLPKTMLRAQGKLLDSGVVKTVGEAELLDKPLRWSVDGEILKFDLTTLNKFLLNKVPLTFTTGKLDLFAEAKSEEGTISGYLKPFVKDLDVVRKEEDFKGSRHFLLEIISAISNIAVKSDEKNESATRVPFIFDGNKLKAETGEGLMKAFEHAFNQEISKGIENTIDLK